MQLALVTNIVPPYRVPVYEELGRLAERFTVISLGGSEPNRAWGAPSSSAFDLRVLRGGQLLVRSRDWIVHFSRGLSSALGALELDALVIGGYDNPGYWAALRHARRRRIPVVLWNGSHNKSSRSHASLIRALKRAFVARCDAFVAYGSRASEYLCDLGASPERIVRGLNAVDCRHFAAPRGTRDEIRARQGVRDEPVILYSGQLVERKGVDTLLRALALVPGPARLWIVGDGPDRARDESLARALIPGRCSFLGNQPYSELPSLYQAADLLVMPSLLEVWGLVLNEAMAAGLPVIATTTSGAAADLVDGQDTGITIPPGDPVALAQAIRKLVADPSLRAHMGERARALMCSHGTSEYASAIFKAAQLACGPSEP